MRKSLFFLPLLATSGLFAITTSISGSNRILRRQHNEGFIRRYGLCPAGKWKLPNKGEEVKVEGIFKPHYGKVAAEIREVIVCARNDLFTLKDAANGEDIPLLPAEQRARIFDHQMMMAVST